MGWFHRSAIEWSSINVHIKDNKLVFTLKLNDEKKANIACGKVKRGKTKLLGITYDEEKDILIYTSSGGTISFGTVAKQFEKMVK